MKNDISRVVTPTTHLNKTTFAVFATVILFVLVFLILISTSQTSFAHGNNNSNDASNEVVEHAKEDAYWAGLAKDYPPFVLPQQASRGESQNISVEGSWGPVLEWPHIPVTAANLPDGRVLTFSSNRRNKFTGSNGKEYTYAATWNPETGNFVERDHPSHDMFCAHLAMLEDGRIIINGGTNRVTTTSIFDYKTNQWSPAAPMSRGRWYPTSLAMPDGSVFTSLGTGGGQYPELWTEQDGWKVLTGASMQDPVLSYNSYYERDWWPLIHVDPKGKILHSGPTPKMHSIDTKGLGSIKEVGPEIHDWYPKHGTTVMYDEGKLLVAGGAISGINQNSTNKAMLIDINGSSPVVTSIDSMKYARKFHNGVILPNGEILVMGGNTTGLKFSDQGTILPSEIWNPESKKWRTVDSISVPRNYHSIALLLTDGRVLSGGGGLCACAADHSNAQVYTPAYLYDDNGEPAARPIITDAPDSIKHGQTLTLNSDQEIQKFTLIKMSSTTHAVNTDLRFLKVPFSSDNNGQYKLTLQANKNILTPGYWMLFALNSKGVPSEAKIIQVKTQGSPQIEAVHDQAHIIGSKITLKINASEPNNEALYFTAKNLPQGLFIDNNTGEIGGTVTHEKIKNVIIEVSNSNTKSAIQFEWEVYPRGNIPGISYEYFTGEASEWQELPDFSRLNNSKLGTINNIKQPSFVTDSYLEGNIYALRFSTRLRIEDEGNYTFYLNSKNGSKLWIDDTLIIDNDGLHDIQEKKAEVFLVKGDYHLILGYLNTDSDGVLELKYKGPGFTKKTIPETAFVQTPLVNVPPEIMGLSDEQNHTIHSRIDLAIIATDANGDPLIFSARGLPPGIQINSSSGHIHGIATTLGEYTSRITAVDTNNTSTSTYIKWVISGELSIEPIIAKPQIVGKLLKYPAITNGGINNQYKWNFGDGSENTPYSTRYVGKYTFTKPGRYTITLTVKSEDETGNDFTLDYQFVQSVYIKPPNRTNEAKLPILPSSSMGIIYDKSLTQDRVWTVNPDNNSVSVFDALMHTKISEISVGNQPRSLAKAPDGKIWVVNKDSASISIIDPNTKKIAQSISLPHASQPYSIVFSPLERDKLAYVTLQATGKLLQIDVDTKKIIKSLDVGNYPRHLSITSDKFDQKIYISRYITPHLPNEGTVSPITETGGKYYGGEVLVVDVNNFSINNTIVLKHSERSDAEHAARGIPNYLGSVALSPDGLSAWVPSKQDNIKRGLLRDGRPLTHDSAVRSVSSKIDLINEEELTYARIDHDNAGIASSSTFGKFGNFIFTALEGSREIEVIDAYSNESVLRFDSGGRAPQGLALSSDGLTLFSHNYMSRTVTVFDLHDLIHNQSNTVSLQATYKLVENEALSTDLYRGKQLFYDSKDERLSAENYSSCAACHNEGATDGRVWDMSNFGEGLRNTISLIGHGGTDHGPLHWSGTFDEVQDFEGQIRTFSRGKGLLPDNLFHNGTIAQPLGSSKKGLSKDLDALALYVESLDKIPDSPFKSSDSLLTNTGKLGEQLFIKKGCNTCHSGQYFTDSALNNSHDIGTIKPHSGQRLNNTLLGIDTPTLEGLWMTAPYLHDGSANTLEEAINSHSNITTNESERIQLAEYLTQIDSHTTQPRETSGNTSSSNEESNIKGGGGSLSLYNLFFIFTLLFSLKGLRRYKNNQSSIKPTSS